MSTNGIIARATGEAKFEGRYHHWDSYPKGLGIELVELYRGHFKRDLAAMLKVLIDEHPAGWSTIVGKDFRLKPGYADTPSRPEGMSLKVFLKKAANRRPHCYCHGMRHEAAQIFTEKDSDSGARWAYVFEPEEKIMHVLSSNKHEDSKEWFWDDVGRIELDSEETINWDVIECGENFERCSHMAWYHNVQPRTSNLSMSTYLGLQPLELHDAIAFIVNGKRYKTTGCGGDSDFYNRTRHPGAKFPPNAWIATVKSSNGRTLEMPVATVRGGSKPYPGVTWVMPPTKNNPKETLVTGPEVQS